jgi:hypothetical protein
MQSAVVVNPILSLTVTRFMQDPKAFVGMRLFPIFMTAEQAATYYVFDAENVLGVPTNIRRGPSAPYARITTKLSSDLYGTQEYGIEVPVDDKTRRKYAKAINADKAAVMRGGATILINHELRVNQVVMAAGISHANVTTQWDTAGSNPVTDVNAAREFLHDQTGMEMNYMQVNRDTFNVLKEHPVILDKIKYTQRGVVTEEILQAVFGVAQFVVAGSLQATNNEGQTLTPAAIWGDSTILAIVNPSDDMESPNFARCARMSIACARTRRKRSSVRPARIGWITASRIPNPATLTNDRNPLQYHAQNSYHRSGGSRDQHQAPRLR